MLVPRRVYHKAIRCRRNPSYHERFPSDDRKETLGITYLYGCGYGSMAGIWGSVVCHITFLGVMTLDLKVNKAEDRRGENIEFWVIGDWFKQ